MEKKATVVTLTNKNGLQLQVSSLGASIMALRVPNRNNELTNIVLGLPSVNDYETATYVNNCIYLGSSIGRYAGRISKGYVEIDGVSYNIHSRNGVSLHGGEQGFDKKLWNIVLIEEGDAPKAVLSYVSRHMEEGYPGNLEVKVTYQLTSNDEFIISYEAQTDQATHVNLTNHNYYNLDGEGSILNHSLQLNCQKYIEVDAQLIPTGKLKDVASTKFDFLQLRPIGEHQFSGLDDTFVFEDGLAQAEISSEKSGIKMQMQTNQPAVVIYTPPNLNHLTFSDGATYNEFPAICFETQKFPDAPHNAHFPSTLLKPGALYLNQTIFTFTKI